jgi:hypothetical protein
VVQVLVTMAAVVISSGHLDHLWTAEYVQVVSLNRKPCMKQRWNSGRKRAAAVELARGMAGSVGAGSGTRLTMCTTELHTLMSGIVTVALSAGTGNAGGGGLGEWSWRVERR